MEDLKQKLERLKEALVKAFEPTQEELVKAQLDEIEKKLKERQPSEE